MTDPMTNTSAPICGANGREAPVRVKLDRVDASLAHPRSPDGQQAVWQARLQKAFGTASPDFVTACLYQLQATARLPGSGVCEVAVNAALALVEGVAPKNEMEASLAIQMAATHCAAMVVLSRLGCGSGSERRVAALGSAAARLLRAYTAQAEVLRRLRQGGQQHVRVEHVHVHDGGQAIVGAVGKP